ncbi:MAG: dTDP-4-dehydrorhamnose 3,5-epimerase family protein [Microbacteriaceae bacterium]|nr:dTDP-4-dehydrorhamnose 3,5-epimerase family protein [Burkholderiaceae bacterium]
MELHSDLENHRPKGHVETNTTGLQGLFVIEPDRSADEHGSYSYYYSERGFAQAGAASHYVQEHASFYPRRHTVRGLHFQKPPHAQYKVVRVARGRIWDVCVDVRRHSPTFGRHAVVELAAGDWRQLHVPPGFAHGFCTLEPDTEITFRLSDYNDRAFSGGLLWNDPALGIAWPCGNEPGYVFPADYAWPPLATLATPFEETTT